MYLGTRDYLIFVINVLKVVRWNLLYKSNDWSMVRKEKIHIVASIHYKNRTCVDNLDYIDTNILIAQYVPVLTGIFGLNVSHFSGYSDYTLYSPHLV